MGDIVCKFGGTSVADSCQICKIESVIRSDPRRRFIVLSAPGKRHGKDTKITDLLYICYDLAMDGLDISAPYGVIKARYMEITKDLGIEIAVSEILDEVEGQIKNGASRDFVASRGEYICGRILSSYLGAEFVDSAGKILFTRDGRLNPETYEKLAEALKGDGTFVIPGFYGSDPKGEIKTFSRGGSDITGAIVARAVNAAVYENWTDVSGFLMADPNIVPDARVIREITYRELRELSYMGAKVLHDEAIFPVKETNIPINIRNTNCPDDPGTMIVRERDYSNSIIVGIAGSKNFTMINVEKALMNKEIGFGRKLLGIVETHRISYEHSPTSIDSMSIIIKDEELGDKGEAVVEDMRKILDPDKVELISGLALIATVGLGMAYRVGMAARLFKALADANINVRIIDQGSSEMNIIVGVKGEDHEKAVKAIYSAFVE